MKQEYAEPDESRNFSWDEDPVTGELIDPRAAQWEREFEALLERSKKAMESL